MLNTPAVVFLVLFILVSFYHLYVCFRLYEKPRRITKLLLMPLLLCFYLCFGKTNPLIILALVTSFVGDMLLVETKGIRIKLGIASFMICQLLYIAEWVISTNWANVTIVSILVPAVLYIVVCVMIFRHIRQGLDGMRLPTVVYLITISSMSFMAFNLMLTTSVWPFGLIFVGSLFFMASDTMLAVETFRSPFKHSNFLIMKTYLIAQTLIIFGVCMS